MTDISVFQRIMHASAAYVARMGGHLTQSGTITKMHEELAEFEDAVKTFDREGAARELIDLLVTIGGVAAWAGLTFEDIEQAAHETLAKLDNRTPETHAWNPHTKTVERIGKVTLPPIDDADFHIHKQLQALGQHKRGMHRED